jgi:hypothetical protein
MAALAISVALLEGLSNEHARRIVDKARRILDDLKP